MKRNKIYVQLTQFPQHLTLDDQKVWPISCREDFFALMSIASICGFDLDLTTEAIPSEPAKRVHKNGLVVSLRRELDEYAALYAFLTDRDWVPISNWASLIESHESSPSIVMSYKEDIHDDLLYWLYCEKSTDDMLATGLIIGLSKEQIWRQTLIQSLVTQSPISSNLAAIDYIESLRGENRRAPRRLIISSDAGSEQIATAFGSGTPLLSLHGHSGGIDMPLSSTLTLCPVEEDNSSFDPAGAPNCILSGYCVAQQKPRQEAIDGENLLPAKSVKAGVLLLNICWGLGSPNDLIEWRWSLITAFMSSGHVGPILTSWALIRTSPSAVGKLSNQIWHGATLGKALSYHNSHAEDWEQIPFCLIGDPLSCIDAVSDSDISMPVRKKRDSGNPNHLAHFYFLKTLCLASKRSFTTEESREISDTLQSLELSLLKGQDLCYDTINMFSELLGKGSIGGPFHYWNELSVSNERSQNVSRCFICDRKVWTDYHRLSIPNLSRRRVSICPNCGIIEDTSEATDCVLRFVDSQTLEWKCEPNKKGVASLIIDQSLPGNRTEWRSSDISSHEVIKLSKPLPHGPFRVLFSCIFEDGEFAAISFVSRSEMLPGAKERE